MSSDQWLFLALDVNLCPLKDALLSTIKDLASHIIISEAAIYCI